MGALTGLAVPMSIFAKAFNGLLVPTADSDAIVGVTNGKPNGAFLYHRSGPDYVPTAAILVQA